MVNKPIDEMTSEELDAELERLQSVNIPSQPNPRKPKRMDDTSGKKKRRSLLDQIMDS